nr:K(+)-transporting ATPase subunit F [Archangium primigenium]
MKGSPLVTFEYVAGAVLAVLLALYLVYALLRPERF